MSLQAIGRTFKNLRLWAWAFLLLGAHAAIQFAYTWPWLSQPSAYAHLIAAQIGALDVCCLVASWAAFTRRQVSFVVAATGALTLGALRSVCDILLEASVPKAMALSTIGEAAASLLLATLALFTILYRRVRVVALRQGGNAPPAPTERDDEKKRRAWSWVILGCALVALARMPLAVDLLATNITVTDFNLVANAVYALLFVAAFIASSLHLPAAFAALSGGLNPSISRQPLKSSTDERLYAAATAHVGTDFLERMASLLLAKTQFAKGSKRASHSICTAREW